MSGEYRRAGAPQGPPSLEELADLHAGVLDGPTAAELRRRVDADPEAQQMLDTLEATSAQLRDLPPLQMPGDVSARIEDALAAEAANRPQVPQQAPAASGAPVVDFAAAKRRRRQRWTLGAGLAGVAAAAAAVVFAVLPGTGGDEQQASPSPDSTSQHAPMALQGDQVQLDGEQFSQVMRSDEYVRTLRDPQQLISCLQANGVGGGKPMGAKEVTLNGQRAQLLILPAGGIGEFRLLTVGPACGAGNPATISDGTFGG
jgi:negative regulator of sigma E activity